MLTSGDEEHARSAQPTRGDSGVREGTCVIVPAAGSPSPRYLERGQGGEGPPRAHWSRAIEELRPGDLVLTHGGRWRQVVEVARREHPGPWVGLCRRSRTETLWVAPEHPVATPLARLPGFAAGVETARRLRREATHSESLLWNELRGGRLGHRFRRQQVIGPYVADFSCPAVRLVVEIDGGIHQDQRQQDKFREELIGQHGVGFVRVSDREVEEDLAAVVARISAAVVEREREVSYWVRWVRACDLRAGDVIMWAGRARLAVIDAPSSAVGAAAAYDVTVAAEGSYATSVCTVGGCVAGRD